MLLRVAAAERRLLRLQALGRRQAASGKPRNPRTSKANSASSITCTTREAELQIFTPMMAGAQKWFDWLAGGCGLNDSCLAGWLVDAGWQVYDWLAGWLICEVGLT